MKKSVLAISLLILGLILTLPSANFAQEAMEAPEVDTVRRARILDNLRFEFPQLSNMSVAFESLEPSGFEGLDQGVLVIQGQQRQPFFISNDDTKFYFLGDGPFDLSRSSEEIQAAMAERKAAENKANADRMAKLDALTVGQPFKGDADAKVTIVEYSDFQCPYCSRAAGTVGEILAKYPEDVKVVYLHLPLTSIHPWAMGASVASVCAAEQSHDAFWTLHDGFFANQRAVNVGNLVEKAGEWLADSGIDLESWKSCSSDTASEAYQAAKAQVDEQMSLAQQLGATGTPAFFVNGTFLNGAQPLASFVPVIDGILAE